MSGWHVPYPAGRLNLHVADRIQPEDAARQERTAAEILRRLETQPGVVLADEVGMGKTFVALAVAVSTAWADTARRPVIVMVPSSIPEKWARDAAVFLERCVKDPRDRTLRVAKDTCPDDRRVGQ